MSVIQPSPPRCLIETTSSSLVITIPSRKHWFLVFYPIFFSAVWATVGITFGGMFLIAAMVPLVGLLGGGGSSSYDFIGVVIGLCGMGSVFLVFVGIWILIALYMLYISLWQLTGVEKVEVDSRSITVRRLVLKGLPVGRPKVYMAEHIKDLRTVMPSPYPMWWRGVYFWTDLDGTIAFDYGAKTYRLGAGVDEAEAKAIIKTIQERFPQYQAT